MKKVTLLLAVAALTALAACDKKPSSVVPSSEGPAVSSVAPSVAPSSEAPSSAAPSSAAPSSAPSSSAAPSSSSAAPSSSSEAPSSSQAPSSSEAPSSSTTPVDPVTTDIIIPDVEAEENFPEAAPYSDKLLLNTRALALAVDNGSNADYSTKQLRGLPRALQAGNDLSFKSLDETVASVDANGNVKGLKAGHTSIEVADKAHPDVKVSVPVDVFNGLLPGIPGINYTQEEIDAAQEGDPAYGKTTDDYKVEPIENDQAQIDAVAAEIAKIDDSGLTEIVDHSIREMSTYKNGKLIQYSVWDENLVCSQDEAYFRIYETDGDTKTENGAMTFTDMEWIFNTNQYYDTYVFHTKGDVKNYYPVSTVDYMPEDSSVNNRTAPLFDILDNIFTSGHDIFTNTLENSRITSETTDLITKDYSNVERNYAGYLPGSTNDFLIDCTILFEDETADQEDETNYGIPFGTKMPATQRMIYNIKDGKLVSFRIELIQNYSFGGDTYQKLWYIDHVYERITDENRDTYIFIPDKSQYTLVDYLFAI